MVLSAVVVILGVAAVAQIGPTSGPYRRTLDRGYAALAQPLVAQSDTSGVALFSFLHQASSLGRIAFFFDLDALVTDTSALQRRYDAITPPDPSVDAGCVAAIGARTAAVSALRFALEGVIGGPTGLGGVDQASATSALVSAGAQLQGADASWAACRRTMRHAPGSALVPASVWVHDPGLLDAAAAGHLVAAVAGSSTLTPVHSIVVLAVVTDPAAVTSGQTLVAPATTTLVVHVVLSNQGNVEERGVELGGEVTPVGSTSKPVLVERTVNLAAARSTTLLLPSFAVEPGSSYTLEVLAESPHSTGTGALASRSIPLQVQPVATLTAVTSTPLVAVRGEPVTLIADVTSSLSGSGAGTVSPTGTVSFADDGVTPAGCEARPVRDGQATCVVTYRATSAHAITAAYSGDARDAGSMSPAITLRVAG
jgi:hypothetical protein